MTLRCTTLTIFWAARLWLGCALFACLVTLSSRTAFAQPHSVSTRVQTGQERDVVLPPSEDVPTFGPQAAPVTLDLFLPFGHRATGSELSRFLLLLTEHDDLRLRVHPVLGSEVAERGAELLLASFHLAGPSAAPFLIAVAEHPDWLTDWPAGRAPRDGGATLGSDRRTDGDLSLFASAGEHGIDVAQLRLHLLQRRHREPALQLWQRVRSAARTPPEIWINGRRLRSPVNDSTLREELERQRRRAYQLLRSGIPLRALYEELVATTDASERVPLSSPASASPWTSSRLLSARPSIVSAPSLPVRPRSTAQATDLDLTDLPLRGPRVSPVTLVLVGSLESGPVCELAREIRDTLRPYAETVRFAYLPAPNGPLLSPLSPLSPLQTSSSALSYGERGQRVPLILSALALENGPAFFRAYDTIIDLMRRRFLLSYVEFAGSILSQRIDFDRLEDLSQSERARALTARAQRDARALGATSLPALFLNGRLLSTMGSLGSSTPRMRSEQLAQLIDAELRRGALEKLRSRRRPSQGSAITSAP